MRIIKAEDVCEMLDIIADSKAITTKHGAIAIAKTGLDDIPTIDPESMRPQWIPVTERMPESMEWVLCLLTDKSIDVLRYDHIMDDWDRKIPNRGYGKKVVTHWMPLPEPPKVGDPR